ncbi:cytochrome P450 [Nocardia sp. GAS34]|uniref:cytochrome P450 n=1 Tax=unclassified Nocardia TaxID=2637762 RepID=UPI003D213756
MTATHPVTRRSAWLFLTDAAHVQPGRGRSRRAGLGRVRTLLLIHRMLRRGWLETRWELRPGRDPLHRYFPLTVSGIRNLAWPEIAKKGERCGVRPLTPAPERRACGAGGRSILPAARPETSTKHIAAQQLSTEYQDWRKYMPQQGACPVAHEGPRVPLHSPEFAADPHGVYAAARREYPSVVPIELAPGAPAMLVIRYSTARRILHDNRFPADPTEWARRNPDSPLFEMLGPRQNALRTAGRAHDRYRAPLTSCLDTVNLYQVERVVNDRAEALINTVCGSGAMDVRADYALPLAFSVLGELMGFPPEIADRAYTGMAAILEGSPDAVQGGQDFAAAIGEVVAWKRQSPGRDLTSQLIAHPERLDNMEVIQSAALLFAAGTEPMANLVINTVRLALTDDRFAGGVLGGSLHPRDAIDEVLFDDPPLGNFCVTYPRQDMWLEDEKVWLPAHQPVVISLSACNTDPAITGADRIGNRSHLSWGAGPHACPAEALALLIVGGMLDQLFDAVPDMELAVPDSELSWRPGAFHRALWSLPVVFPPSPPMILATSPLPASLNLPR